MCFSLFPEERTSLLIGSTCSNMGIQIEWAIVFVCQVGEHQHWMAHQSMFTMWKLCTHMKCEVRHNWDMGMEHL